MNGLEAIEFMKQGKMVVDMCAIPSVYRINNGTVEFKSYEPEEWLLIQYFDLKGQYEEYIEPKPLTGWERVKEDEKYHYIRSNMTCGNSYDCKCFADDATFEKANYFSTKEKAEEITFKQTLFRKLQRFSDENGGNEIDWSDLCSRKFFIAYKDGKLFYDWMTETRYFGQVYFASTESVKKAIELFYDDLIKYFTHDWSVGIV